MTQDRLKSLLSGSSEKKPIQKGKPLGLSIETEAAAVDSTSAKSHDRTIAPAQQYKRVNRGYKLREDLIKECKLLAVEQDKMLYEIMEAALVEYLEKHKAEK